MQLCGKVVRQGLTDRRHAHFVAITSPSMTKSRSIAVTSFAEAVPPRTVEQIVLGSICGSVDRAFRTPSTTPVGCASTSSILPGSGTCQYPLSACKSRPSTA